MSLFWKGGRTPLSSIGRSNGALEIFEAHPKIRILTRPHADYDREKAAAVVKGLLEKGHTIDAFFCVNDLMALGVADVIAMKQREISRKPMIVGVDLIDEAREAIRKGLIDASVAFSRSEVAAFALNMAAANDARWKAAFGTPCFKSSGIPSKYGGLEWLKPLTPKEK